MNRVLELSWLREEVTDCYCADNGRPGIDPEVAVLLMLAGLLPGYVHDRRLLRDAQVNLAIRWFIGYGLSDRLPDHSSLTRIWRRHMWRSEGYHGEAKTWHGLARVVRRGLESMKIQSYLTAAAINLKRLSAAFLGRIYALWRAWSARKEPLCVHRGPRKPRRLRVRRRVSIHSAP